MTDGYRSIYIYYRNEAAKRTMIQHVMYSSQHSQPACYYELLAMNAKQLTGRSDATGDRSFDLFSSQASTARYSQPDTRQTGRQADKQKAGVTVVVWGRTLK